MIETDLIRMRIPEGMNVAKANGRLRGKQAKVKPNQAKHLLELHDLGTYTQAELAELFGVGRSGLRSVDEGHATRVLAAGSTRKCRSPSSPISQ